MKLLITTQAVDIDDPILGFFHGWLQAFSKHFERIDVICLREGKHELPNNVFVHSLGKERGGNRLLYVWRFYKYVWHFFLMQRVDFVFYHMGAVYNVLAAPFFLMRNLKQTKFFWWKTHGKLNQIKERLALLFCDTVFTAGSKSFDVQSSKVQVVGHAVDTNIFAFKPKPLNENDTIKFIAVGRVVPIKKLEITFNIFAAFSKKHKAEINIIGPYENNKYKQLLDDEIKKNQIGNIEFVGPQTQHDLVSYYHSANVLLHPAYEAGFDKAVLEAMATGVIPITSILSFSPVLMPYGLYVQPTDVDGYVTVLERLLQMSPEEIYKLQNELRGIIVNEHSLSTLSKRIFHV